MNIFVPSKQSIRRAGEILRSLTHVSESERQSAINTLSQWRKLHSYPSNTFQAYFRNLAKKHFPKAIVAQRLKRMPSIIHKLERFPSMNLDRMQDICGFRIIVENTHAVYAFYDKFAKSTRFRHELVLPPKDYIKNPKQDGYRSLHQVFKYTNKSSPELNDLRVELQIRTHLQHMWATAVETLGIVEKSSFKTGEGSEKFKQFFKLSADLFAFKAFKDEKKEEIIAPDEGLMPSIVEELNALEEELQISQTLTKLILSAKHIETSSSSDAYHIMELNTQQKRLSLIAFSNKQLEDAEMFYKMKEEQEANNPNVSLVLISAGNIKEIKKAYPNYFLDTKNFIRNLQKIKKSFA